FALNHRHGLEREIGDRKVFGVFEHSVANGASTTFAMDDTIKAPHSRWGNIDPLALAKAGLNILAENEDIGWLIAEESSTSGHTSTYLQGHPEYWRNDLHDEYIRDQQFVPSNYYPDNAPEQVPVLSWSNDARSLLSNWIQKIYANFSIAGTD